MSKYKGMTITAGRHKLHILWSPLYIAVWLLLYYIISIIFHILPTPLPDDDNHHGRFIAEKAERNLLKLTNLGPRVVGSPANEQAAIEFLIKEVNKIKENCSDDYVIEADSQIASYGGFRLGKIVNTYQSIQNYVVKLSPKILDSNSSLLLNSHFDSVPGSPGAGDDGFMVVIMLEVLRVLSQSQPNKIKHSIIFLFNGAEETSFQGSHAFITQHPWAKEVKAFINLDSMGNGGKEILFQSVPRHLWLIKYYKNSTPHPFASSLAEELFQSGIIASDTDFSIFREYGQIPGLDLAHAYNGYVYHTKYDRFSTIPLGTYQHTGDNVLELTKSLANAPELEDIPKEKAEGHSIFYDFLGLFTVLYTAMESLIINASIALISLITIIISLTFMANNSGLSFLNVLSHFIISIFVQISAILLGCGIPYLLAFIFDLTGRTLSWYSNPWLIFGIYVCPLLFGLGVMMELYFSLTRDNFLLLNHRIQLILHAHCILLIFALITCVVINIWSGFLAMIAIFFYTATLGINLVTTFHNKAFLWLIPHLVGQVMPFVYFSYQAHFFLTSYIPMADHPSNSINPEYIVCTIAVIFGLLLSGFLMPIICIFRQAKIIISGILVVAVIFIVTIYTPVGFPYRADSTPQRYVVAHTARSFNDFDGSVRQSDSGFTIYTSDHLSPASIKDHVINASLIQNIQTDFPSDLLCGFSTFTNNSTTYWIPAEEPRLLTVPNIRLVSKDTFSNSITRFSLELKGPDSMYIIITPASNEIELVNWSLPVPFVMQQWTAPYLIKFTYGVVDPSPAEIFFDFKIPEDWTDQTFGIGVVGRWKHHSMHYTDKFKEFLESFPDWAYVHSWIGSYDSWVF